MILKLESESVLGVRRSRHDCSFCLCQPHMVSLRLGQTPNCNSNWHFCQPRVCTEHFLVLNLCPTSQITPNVICLGIIVFSQAACCIMRCETHPSISMRWPRVLIIHAGGTLPLAIFERFQSSVPILAFSQHFHSQSEYSTCCSQMLQKQMHNSPWV